ncbi:hypothetical protein ONZ45_g1480 [Pleurotus djamor]|nr:hypothetical protein ONZ45_g1480 [Pleurotus djamor]
MVAFFSLVSASFLLAAGSALAAPQPAPSGLSAVAVHYYDLSARQAPGLNGTAIPDQCKSQCDGLVKLQSCNGDLQCICNDGTADSLNSCFKCILSLDNTTEGHDVLQTALDKYHDACKEAGVNVKNEKLNGASEMRPAVLGISALMLLVATAATLL